MLYYFFRDEYKASEYIEKLPPGKHSCMGIGRTKPDPAESLFIEDKIEVPLGKPISSNINDTSLLYNEYPFFLHLEIKLILFRFFLLIKHLMYYYSKSTL